MNTRQHNIGHGDSVAFIDYTGAKRTGKANGLLIFADHVVLDAGGQHGRPVVVPRADILRVTPRRRKGI